MDLERFVQAQGPVIDAVLAELGSGRKRSHWMWFVFPQLQGLGASAMAQRYALASLEEARAYLAHPVLGQRLRQCCELMLRVPDRTAHEVLGSPDDIKFRSCVTLFREAVPQESLFQRCLDRYYGGQADEKTLALLRQA
jgi:uncharacterized protein (DUF1810 family)